MPIGEGLYAHVETEFMRSAKFTSLPAGARILYLTLWCYALDLRREIIERPSANFLARMTGLKHHSIVTYLKPLHDLHLTVMNEGYIALVGLRKKHNKIKFKPEFENTGIEFKISPDCSFLSYPFLSLPASLPKKEAQLPPISPQGECKGKTEIKPDPDFDIFRASYPKAIAGRCAWAATRKKWDKVRAEGVAADTLIQAAKDYAIQSSDPQYVMGSQKFLGPSRHWQEYVGADLSRPLTRAEQSELAGKQWLEQKRKEQANDF